MILVPVELVININHHATARNEDVGKRNLSGRELNYLDSLTEWAKKNHASLCDTVHIKWWLGGNWGGGCVLLKLSLQITSSENLAVVIETSVWMSPAPSFVVVVAFCLCFESRAYVTLAENSLARGIADWHVVWCSLAPCLIIHSLLSWKKDGEAQMASRVSECMDFKKKWSFLLSSSLGRTLRCCGAVIVVMMMILMTSYFDTLWFVKCFSFTLFMTLGIKSCMWLDSFDS